MKALLPAAVVATLSAPAALAASFEEMFPGVAEQMGGGTALRSEKPQALLGQAPEIRR